VQKATKTSAFDVTKVISTLLVFYACAQALSLYRDVIDLCRRALKRRPPFNIDDDDDDVAYFRDSASLASVRAKAVEDSLVVSVERHLLAKNGLVARYIALSNAKGGGGGGGGGGDGGEWLRTVLSRCSEASSLASLGKTDLDDVPSADAASASSSSSSSLATNG